MDSKLIKKIKGAYITPAPRILEHELLPLTPHAPLRPIGCNFCKKNGEPIENFTSHRLRDDKGIVQCPILRSYVCKFCHETGDNAHTISYCPYAKQLQPIIDEVDGRQAFINMGDLQNTYYNAARERPSPNNYWLRPMVMRPPPNNYWASPMMMQPPVKYGPNPMVMQPPQGFAQPNQGYWGYSNGGQGGLYKK